MRSRKSILQVRWLIFILAFTGLAFGMTPAQLIQEKNEFHLDQFDLLTATSGWVLLDQHLLWSSDAGQTWQEISPSIPLGAVVQDVSFLDANTGWMLWTLITSDDGVVFQLADTIDHGTTWAVRPLPLFDSGEIASYAEKAEMGWFDAQTGWISVKQSSGSNFSIGTLFTTSDGGDSWKRFTLPVADKISFSDPQAGWAIGGAAGDQIFKTINAGATWQDFRPDDLSANTLPTVHMLFSSGNESLLVLTTPGLENRLRVYSLNDPADQWLLVDQVTLDVQPGIIGLSILDSRNFVAAIPGTTSIVQMADSRLNLIDNLDGRSASILELDMVSLEVGWAKSIESICVRASRADSEPGSVSCSSDTRLLQTTDGGRTWQSIYLPLVQSDVIAHRFSGIKRSFGESTASGSGYTEVFIGQGFDKCELPTSSQLQTWWNSSPYDTVNLYIGGSSRACANSALNLPYIRQIYQQGWKFIPTWVGPQAPCTGFLSRFSSDVTTAYNQGINEANLAVERLAELGLTNPDKTGSVVYYDIEHYGTNSTCRSAVNAFMNGWVSQLKARGNIAGIYASTLCNTGLNDFLNITHVPDVIWPARWYHSLGSGYYDPNASVWNLGSCVPNTVWANHQRIRQYEGGHNESWGSLTLEIDSNVLDGVVAIPNVIPFVNRITRADASPTDAEIVVFTVTFSESVTGVGANDFMLTTTGVSEASIIDVSGSGSTYTVSVNTGAGNGTLQLDVPVTAAIANPAGTPLGWLPFTSGESYTVDKRPIAAGLLSPNGSIGANYKPTYTWNKVTGATWYYLWVDGTSGNVIQQWYDASLICSAGTCSAAPNTTLAGGDFTWWIQTWNSAGYGPWSDSMTFSTVPLGAAPLLSPTGDIGANYSPEFVWNEVSGATWYYLWINGPSGNVLKQWYESSAVCSAGSCSVVPAGLTLSSGSHTWWVQTWNEGGYGAWSDGKTFSVPLPPLPGKATLFSPNGSIGTNNPTYTWNEVTGATWYYLWVDGSSGHVFDKWYTSAQANCNGSTCSVTPPITLSAGSHTWWVQTWNEAGYGPWSDAKAFTVSPPGAATLLSPNGSVSNNPTYTWNQVDGTTWYYLWVNGPNGNVFQQWYTAAQANCNGTTCSVTSATPNLSAGSYTWWVQTWSNVGYGPWSTGMTFSVSP